MIASGNYVQFNKPSSVSFFFLFVVFVKAKDFFSVDCCLRFILSFLLFLNKTFQLLTCFLFDLFWLLLLPVLCGELAADTAVILLKMHIGRRLQSLTLGLNITALAAGSWLRPQRDEFQELSITLFLTIS